MLNINPGFSLSGFTHRSPTRQNILRAPGGEIPAIRRAVSAEPPDFIWCIPLRYSVLPVRRRLVRMMLTMKKYSEAGGSLECVGRNTFTPAADYARSVIDSAILHGELRCQPSDAMTRAFLNQTGELRSIMAGVQQDTVLLRKEVRRRTDDFLWQYGVQSQA